ncbi:NAD(P)H-dependent oxidoreductase [Arenivirga flava]|uniref:NAD(P)H dehydrogenase (Quinone) n=1 Tax=Arenivirga flava TaxID=1930060 RepID=A0AA37UH15_9MICO|nr:NAD(P)H-dependent oxidoreductase [Arenivirga flava]GMA29350.1 NAD(P)H dehydrogenase (quinone) [Arenivirga flava]
MTALVIDGHPDEHSLVAALARAYVGAHPDARLLAVRDLRFDPVLRHGYRQRMELEPDLVEAWAAILEADRVVVLAPIWWGSVPAELKGFLDRLLLPRRAYRYGANGLPEGLLRGRRGRIVLSTDSPWWYLLLTGNPAAKQLRSLVLGFCGIRTERAVMIGPVRGSTDARRAAWIERMRRTAERDSAADARRASRPRNPVEEPAATP